MKISELITEETIIVNLEVKTKNELFKKMIDILNDTGKIKDKKLALTAVKDREEIMTTGVGQGVAIPHAKCAAVDELVIAFAKLSQPINYNAIDNEPVTIVFMLITPETAAGPHIKALARISRLMKHKYFRETLMKAGSKEKVIDIIKEDEKRY